MTRTFWIVAGLFMVLASIVAGLRTNIGRGSLSETKSAFAEVDLNLVSQQSPYMRNTGGLNPRRHKYRSWKTLSS
jgi:hypothetical protein